MKRLTLIHVLVITRRSLTSFRNQLRYQNVHLLSLMNPLRSTIYLICVFTKHHFPYQFADLTEVREGSFEAYKCANRIAYLLWYWWISWSMIQETWLTSTHLNLNSLMLWSWYIIVDVHLHQKKKTGYDHMNVPRRIAEEVTIREVLWWGCSAVLRQ